MSPIHPLSRFMRHDAHRFLRHDWRRYVQPGSELASLSEQIERKFRPDQLRVPAGVREGGQWTSEGGGAVVLASSGARGHHFVPKGVYEKVPLRAETKKVFEDRTTGTLQDRTSNQFDQAHRAYNDAVDNELQAFMKEKGITPEQMTPAQAREFIDRVVSSNNPAIRNLNLRIYMREIMRGLWRRSRGGE